MNHYPYSTVPIEMHECNVMEEYRKEVEQVRHDFFCFIMKQFPSMRYMSREMMKSLFVKCIILQINTQNRDEIAAQLNPFATLPYTVYFDIHMIGRRRLNLILSYTNGL